MRTDAQIDKQLVRLPNASLLGFGKGKAQYGDIVTFCERYTDGNSCNIRVGRVAGRIHYAPALTGDDGPVRDWLLVIALSDDMTFVMERWVNPTDVTRCIEPTDKQRSLMGFLLGDWRGIQSPETLRTWAGSGYSTVDDMPERQVSSANRGQHPQCVPDRQA